MAGIPKTGLGFIKEAKRRGSPCVINHSGAEIEIVRLNTARPLQWFIDDAAKRQDEPLRYDVTTKEREALQEAGRHRLFNGVASNCVRHIRPTQKAAGVMRFCVWRKNVPSDLFEHNEAKAIRHCFTAQEMAEALVLWLGEQLQADGTMANGRRKGDNKRTNRKKSREGKALEAGMEVDPNREMSAFQLAHNLKDVKGIPDKTNPRYKAARGKLPKIWGCEETLRKAFKSFGWK